MSRHLMSFSSFQNELSSRAEEINNILPPNVNPEKFRSTALIAIKNNNGLLAADRRSLHKSITQAAEDGLMPDGREGVITAFNVKQRDNSKILTAQWNPMIKGIRKRAMELAEMIIDAQVVYKNDEFVWFQGDDARIQHIPSCLGEDRGKPVGAYAIFRRGDVILHREVMDANQIEDVKSSSMQKSGLLWNKFWTEAWRKSVVRRGIKTVPCVPDLERIIERDDQSYSFRPQLTVIEGGSNDDHRTGAPDSGLSRFQEAVSKAENHQALCYIWDTFEGEMPEQNSDYIEVFEAKAKDFANG